MKPPRQLERHTVFSILLSMVFATVAKADEKPAAHDISVSAVRILETKCVSCHGAEKQLGGLRLDSLNALTAGGEGGPVIVVGDVSKSRLIEAIHFTNPDLQMPPKLRLSDREIRTLERWVKEGPLWPEDAYDPAGGRPAGSSQGLDEGPIGDAFTDPRNPVRKIFAGERLDLWSLKSPQATMAHGAGGSDDAKQPKLSSQVIDQFIHDRLTQQGLTPSPQADRRTLLRRVTFDLTGLPPTPEELHAFLEDPGPDAYETVVDRLLQSSRYGERWARHWLDVVRYADTDGFERDEFRPNIWRYRDYVIRSFNQDKPFDQFAREQLAGDELLNSVPQTVDEIDNLIATGFLRLGQWDSTAAIFQEEDRHRDQQLADLANTTASAFLGLTFSCCQCHDHKYDPLLQADHFRMRAFFAAVTPRNDLPIELADELDAIARQNADIDAQIQPLKEEQSKLNKEQADEQPRFEELGRKIDELESQKRSPTITMGATDSGTDVPATHVFYQGDFSQPREEVAPGILSALDPGPMEIRPPREGTSGRRLALANWIASAENPWTARVLVNRVWQHHFGVGLVATPNDYGFSGSRPSHPELLDWLAVAFVNDGWSLKKLHRAIVCSATYRQASSSDTAHPQDSRIARCKERDPSNTLLWRQNVVRLDAESLRDTLLAVSGALQPFESGRPRWPHVPLELLHAQPGILEAKDGGDGGRMQGWYEDPVEETDVRSLFLVRKRAMPIPFLQAFDLPDSTVSCARRDTTVVAPQALVLLNSPESVRLATILAERIDGEAEKTPQSRVEVLFRRALIRSPEADELDACGDLLQRHADQYRSQGLDESADRLALRDLCRVIMNLNEFTYID